MKTIWKFPITNLDRTTLQVPFDGFNSFNEQVLYCEVQSNVPCLWVKVDTEQPTREVNVFVFGTGHNVDMVAEMGMSHVGSFMLLNGNFVGHMFAYDSQKFRFVQ